MRRIVVLGAAGFLGSHLVDRFIKQGDEVVGVDDLSSGSIRNIEHLANHPRFTFYKADISRSIPVGGSVDGVLNFASLASPPRYVARQRHTLRTGSTGTENALELATKHDARFLMASTSEIYGDPKVHPQDEAYWGNVNPIGARSCYDESKRYAEALCMAYQRECHTNIAIARIFNTYGPRLDIDDGRVVSNFISQAIHGQPLTIYGNGEQTRSFCFVDDLIRGLLALFDSPQPGPINLGNPIEHTMLDLAKKIIVLAQSSSTMEYRPLPQDDPVRRKPDISSARTKLGWYPEVDLEDGLLKTIDWFRRQR
jgi:dTDP-glucose 4,6-dehydratase